MSNIKLVNLNEGRDLYGYYKAPTKVGAMVKLGARGGLPSFEDPNTASSKFFYHATANQCPLWALVESEDESTVEQTQYSAPDIYYKSKILFIGRLDEIFERVKCLKFNCLSLITWGFLLKFNPSWTKIAQEHGSFEHNNTQYSADELVEMINIAERQIKSPKEDDDRSILEQAMQLVDFRIVRAR